MKSISSSHLVALSTTLLIVGLFVGATFLAQLYAADLELFLIGTGWQSMVGYVLVTALGTVLAPISTVPLIPVVVQSWGWMLTGILSVFGWVIGSQIAFLLARRYGVRLISHFTSLTKLHQYETSFSNQHLFWTIVVLRMLVPVDVLSYALGLFSTISAGRYLLATTIGVIPFAFIFSYTGTLPPGLQVLVLIEVGLLLVLVYIVRRILREMGYPKSTNDSKIPKQLD